MGQKVGPPPGTEFKRARSRNSPHRPAARCHALGLANRQDQVRLASTLAEPASCVSLRRKDSLCRASHRSSKLPPFKAPSLQLLNVRRLGVTSPGRDIIMDVPGCVLEIWASTLCWGLARTSARSACMAGAARCLRNLRTWEAVLLKRQLLCRGAVELLSAADHCLERLDSKRKKSPAPLLGLLKTSPLSKPGLELQGSRVGVLLERSRGAAR